MIKLVISNSGRLCIIDTTGSHTNIFMVEGVAALINYNPPHDMLGLWFFTPQQTDGYFRPSMEVE